MKKNCLLGAAALAFLSALGHFGAKPLLAQIRAALVKNIDEPGRSPYQYSSDSIDGIVIGSCGVFGLPPVPDNKRLVVENLNVRATIPGGTTVTAGRFFGTRFGEIERFGYFNFSYAGGSVWIANLPVRSYINSGLRPSVDLSVGGTCSLSVTLSGYLVDLNQ